MNKEQKIEQLAEEYSNLHKKVYVNGCYNEENYEKCKKEGLVEKLIKAEEELWKLREEVLEENFAKMVEEGFYEKISRAEFLRNIALVKKASLKVNGSEGKYTYRHNFTVKSTHFYSNIGTKDGDLSYHYFSLDDVYLRKEGHFAIANYKALTFIEYKVEESY